MIYPDTTIDQEKLIEAYCSIKTKEEIIADLDIDNMDIFKRDRLFCFFLHRCPTKTIKRLLKLVDKKYFEDYIKSQHRQSEQREIREAETDEATSPEGKRNYTVLDKTYTTPAEMELVMTDTVPQWYRVAVSKMENGDFPQKWRSRYWALLKVLRSGRKPYMYAVLYDAYAQAVEEAKAKIQAQGTAE